MSIDYSSGTFAQQYEVVLVNRFGSDTGVGGIWVQGAK